MAVELHSPIAAVSSAPAPVTIDDRLHTLDILRGIALFGMILVHFHQKMRIEVTGLEDLIGWGVWILVEQKAWESSLFCSASGSPCSCGGWKRAMRRSFPFISAVSPDSPSSA